MAMLRLLHQNEAKTWSKKAEAYLPQSRCVFGALSIGLLKNLVNLSQVKFYVPIDEQLPFFIIILGLCGHKDMKNCTPFWNPEEFEEDTLMKLLLSLPEWNWQNKMCFYYTSLPVLRKLESLIIRPGGLGQGKVYLTESSRNLEGYTYSIEKEDIDLSYCKYLERNFDFGSIDVKYAQLMYENHIYNHWYNVHYAKTIVLSTLPTMGVYPKNLEGNERKPVSWVVYKFSGDIGLTTTISNYRGRGLAKAATLKLCDVIWNNYDTIPVSAVVDSNPSSIKFHKDLGFKKEASGKIGYHEYNLI